MYDPETSADHTVILKSSEGYVEFNEFTGVVVGYHEDDTSNGTLAKIYAVDCELLKSIDPVGFAEGESDILFAGFWYVTDRGSTGYEPPEWDYVREMTQDEEIDE